MKFFESNVLLCQRTVSRLSPKKSQKNWKMPISRFRTFVFQINVASKPFSKKLATIKFSLKQFSTLSLTFPENGFNFVTQKFAKNWKVSFSKFRTFVFELKVASKPFSKRLSLNNLWFTRSWKLCIGFNGFNIATQKFAKISEIIFSEH